MNCKLIYYQNKNESFFRLIFQDMIIQVHVSREE